MREIEAGPTKEFFIEMITRDIQLNKAILDLIDNSIDGAKRTERFNDKIIDIEMNEDKFQICDNCGGFSIAIAREYAFKFGRKENQNENKVDYSIGRFGVGMKRTLFKLGKNFYIESRTNEEHFKIEVDVEKWKKDTEWKFDLVELEYDQQNKWTGTKIVITNLYSDISKVFNDRSHNDYQLGLEIGYSYSKLISNGLKIVLNKEIIKPLDIEMIYDNHFMPSYRKLSIGNVEVKILAGISLGDPNSAGWYIYGNDRLLLMADKTKITGWGTKENGVSLPQFHPTYAMFRGVVFMTCQDVMKLPLTTTKVGVDIDSETYKVILYNMGMMMKEVFSFIKQADSKNAREIYEMHKKEFSFNIRNEYVSAKIDRKEFIFDFNLDAEKASDARITFYKPKEQVERLKKELHLRTNGELGEFTYDYYIDMECID